MPDIRYVCLSDLHFGEEDSLLTNLKTASTDPDPSQASPVLQALVECLQELIAKNEQGPKPTLILNGDILEFALASDNQALMVFERFMELVMPPQGALFDRIIYIPGNHDHHLWESARETQYVNYISSQIKPGQFLPIPWHTTNMFVEHDPNPVPAYLLTRLVQRYDHLKQQDFMIATAYPNFGLLREDGQKCVIFHHGHFIEPLYHLISTVRTLCFPDRTLPTEVWTTEAENFAWIDFFWSMMGRSGDAGQDIELLYERMQDTARCKQLLATLATSLAQRYDLPGWGDTMEAKLLRCVFDGIVDTLAKRERHRTDQVLSAEAEKGLWAYMNGPLRQQLLTERKGQMPSDVTLVFGHTHKPFQADLNFRGFPQWVNVYNTGGWVVETIQPEPLHGGAVVFVDEHLDAVSLRVYNESHDAAGYTVKIEQAMHPGEPHHPLYTRLSGLVDPAREPWKRLSEALARAVSVRAQNLRARINERV
jgi:UDP-2,3-diacylglucosamine pyrophosphatase LpxH